MPGLGGSSVGRGGGVARGGGLQRCNDLAAGLDAPSEQLKCPVWEARPLVVVAEWPGVAAASAATTWRLAWMRRQSS